VRGSKPTCQIAEQTLTVPFSLAKGEATHTCPPSLSAQH
jgi:hypothetical protein